MESIARLLHVLYIYMYMQLLHHTHTCILFLEHMYMYGVIDGQNMATNRHNRHNKL